MRTKIPAIPGLVLLALLCACTAKPAPSQKKSSKPTTLLITEAAGENDDSFVQSAFKGILKFYGETWDNQTSRGILYNTVRCISQNDYKLALKSASEERKWDIIVMTGFIFADPLIEIAPQYPEQKFAIIDVDWVNAPNVAQYIFAEHEGSYLAGAVAALKALESGIAAPVFGFIGGIPSSTITKFEVGYVQGIRSIIPDAEIVDFYAGSWNDPDAAYAQAKTWYDSGVFAIFSAAGGTGSGAIEQTRTCRRRGMDVWAVGVDVDQHDVGLYAPSASAVLTSMIKRVETATFTALTSVQNNAFTGNSSVALTLEQEGVGFTTAMLSGDIIDRVNGIRNDIINKRVRVIPTYRDALAARLVPPSLKALDN
ncbi:MAG: BMP family ABC transporter substrate-binding protein [Treponema sp.]|nr:BMP family ABC transporter substrate-binding protein [Treponema sp.]